MADDFLIALPLPHGQSMRTINKTNDLCHRILLNMHLSVLWQSILYIFLLCSAVRFANEVYAPNEKNNPNRPMFFVLSICWSSFGLFVGFSCSNIKINSQICFQSEFNAKKINRKSELCNAIWNHTSLAAFVSLHILFIRNLHILFMCTVFNILSQ